MGDAPFLMGIDIGTTAVKVVVYDTDGRERHRYARAYPTARNGAFSEQDPADWMRCLSEAFDEIARAGHAPAIAAIGVTSQVNTHVFCAADGTPVHPAITWADTRARVAASSLDAGITEAERATWWGAAMGVDASHMAARMAWMAQAKPDLWAATAQVLLPKDWVIGQLTGAYVSDPVSQIGAVGAGRRLHRGPFRPDRRRTGSPAGAARPRRRRGPCQVAGRRPRGAGGHRAHGRMGVDVRRGCPGRGRRDVSFRHQRDPRCHLGNREPRRGRAGLSAASGP